MKIEQQKGKCPNCGHETSGKFCSNCGQKTKIPHENFFYMMVHFVSDYFHYDGKFWATFKMLLIRPGKLSTMYLQGKRASYLKPVQLYIFVSAVFFLVFFKMVHLKVSADGKSITSTFSLGGQAPGGMTDSAFAEHERALRKQRDFMKTGKRWTDSALAVIKPGFSRAYIKPFLARKWINYSYRNKLFIGSEIVESVLTAFIHSIPKLFFLLMPVMALLLKLFFRKNEYVYVDHAVMSLHLHSFLFISYMLGSLLSFIGWDNGIFDLAFFILIPMCNFFVACRNFYKASWIKTLFKGALTLGIYIVLILLSSLLNIWLLIV